MLSGRRREGGRERRGDEGEGEGEWKREGEGGEGQPLFLPVNFSFYSRSGLVG